MKNFKSGQQLIEISDAASKDGVPVTFIRWFNKERTYARIRYNNTGKKLSVSKNILFA